MPTYVSLPSSKRKLLPNSRLAGNVQLNEMVSLTIHVRSGGNFEKLEAEVLKQSELPIDKRKYLTREDLREQFGASDADLDAVEKYAQQHNLMVVHRNAAERSVVVRGRLSDLLGAFPAQVKIYHHSTGTYRGRQGEIRIPKELQGIVTGIYGYDTRPRHRSRRRLIPAGGPGGGNGVAATEFATRYKFPTKNGGTKLDGTGQTIAIIELGGGFRNNDLKIFFNEIGVPLPEVVSVSVDHGGNHPAGNPNSADGEVLLDIEVAGAVAPGARIAVYFAPNTDKGFLDAITAAVHDAARKPSVISISWGSPEDASDPDLMNAYHHAFIQAAAVGVTVCVAAGDHGTVDVDPADWDGKIHVDHPSADDLVLSCGGTQIKSGKDVVWNEPDGWTTGGGISEFFPVPGYQAGANIPKSIATGKTGRGVPDIAMSATNYFFRADGFEGATGGTSAVAPLMAGLIALLNQAKQQNVGFFNPFLYANANTVFADVTSGTNAITSPVTAKGYKAGTGWDACTGLGTPIGTAILSNLSASAPSTKPKKRRRTRPRLVAAGTSRNGRSRARYRLHAK